MDPRCSDIITLVKAVDKPNYMQFLLKIMERHVEINESKDASEPYRELRLHMEKNYNLMDLDSRLTQDDSQ